MTLCKSNVFRAILFFGCVVLVGCIEKPVARKDAFSSFIIAGHVENFAKMERLLKLYPDLISERCHEETLLHNAAMVSQPTTVEFLLKHGAEINVRNKYGETPLFLAVQSKRLENVVLLLNAGADLSIADSDDGESPLERAAGRGLPEIMKVLIEHGADVDRVNNGRTPLMKATEWNQPDAVDALLACKAKVNIRDSIGQTVLMHAIDRDNGLKSKSESAEDIRIVKSLLAAGADPDLARDGGDTPRSLAKKYKDKLPQIAKLLGVE